MKKRLPTFLAGMLTAALIGGLGVTALAAAGQMTITVDPISIQVNGQTFQPKDAKGNDVPVFSLNGTTYAPLRALAEAYGLTVGYDQAANMATVTDPNATSAPQFTPAPDYSTWTAEEEAAYLEFKGMWSIGLGVGIYGNEERNIAQYNGTLDRDTFIEQMQAIGRSNLQQYMLKMSDELDLSGASNVQSLEFYWGMRNPNGDMFNVGYVYFGDEPPVVIFGGELQFN